MQVLVIVEHADGTIRPGSRSAITFARSVAESNGGEVALLLLGHELDSASLDAASYAPVLVADHADLTDPVADRYAQGIAQVVTAEDADLVVAGSTTFA
ncbi:MAG: hypothetical protein GY917_23795 [Planctomycetaceae bacterium]|nr:hypothetical protein [Planctomycetaceae bacterium]